MTTLSNWPAVATTEAAAMITVQHYRHSPAQDAWEFIICPTLEDAGAKFRATCARLRCGPYHQSRDWTVAHIAYGPVEGEPGGQYGSMGTYGVKVTVYAKDARRPNDWQRPGIDATGRIYIPAFTRPAEPRTLPGYGYMRKREPRIPLPPGTVQGDTGPDSVDIGGIAVAQSELDRVYAQTGQFATHVTHDDYSGSYRYLSEIVWGQEPQIVAAELAAR